MHGAAYRIPPEHVEEVSAYLDIREINGYSIQYTDFYPFASSSHRSPIRSCLVYIGLPTNPQFLGVQDPADVAEVISRNKGPSGKNDEYLFMLECALEGLGEGISDEHIKDLATRVRKSQAGSERQPDGAAIGVKAVKNEITRVVGGEQGSYEDQEETEK